MLTAPVGQGSRGAENGGVEHRGHDAVARVLGDGLGGGPDYAGFGEFGGVAAYDVAREKPGFFQVSGF